MALRGHNDLVHDICWSPDDRFLVTASADGACRVWTLDSDGIGHADKLNYQGNDEHFFVCELYHPSFVYGAKLHPTRQEGFLYIATVCFDNKVRIWSVNVSDPQNPWYKLETEVSIEEPPNFTLGTKKTIYEHGEDLEDETLRLIMNPQDQPDAINLKNLTGHIKTDNKGQTARDAEISAGYKSLMETKHPNAIVFDNEGRLFVGDSHGQINVWRVLLVER